MTSSGQEMEKTADRFRVNIPFGNLDVGFKPALFDKVPTDLSPQQEEVVGDAAALIGQMLRHDMLVPENHKYLHGNSELDQLTRDQYADLGDDAAATYAADVKAVQGKARKGGYDVMFTARDAWGHGAESAPAVSVVTARTDDEQSPIGYELKLTGNAIGGSEYNNEVLPNVVPGIASITISESGSISMRTRDGKILENISEDQQKYIRNLLVKLQGKVSRGTEQIARKAA